MIALERFWQDIRHAGRMFAKNPGFTAIAVVSIAFGTGANVAIFSAADALLLRPLPVSRPGELVTVGSRTRFGLATNSIASYSDFLDIRSRSQSFDGLIAFTSRTAGISPRAGATPHMRIVALVSHDFFSVLGVEPALGRGFLPEEDRVAGRDPVVVLGYPLWQQEFGGDTGVLGRTIRVGGIACTIVGVAPERFTGMDDRFRSAAYVPLAMWPALLNLPDVHPLADRSVRQLTIKGRLKPRVTLGEAQAELTTIAKDLERSYPKTNTNQTLSAQSEFVVKFERRPLDSGLVVLVTILSVAVLCVACANVAGLLASRAPVRAREIALRLAIGAGRARLIRQLITESAGMALLGGVGGVLLGGIGIRLMQQIHFSSEVFVAPEIRLDERALIFSLIVAMSSAVLFGLGPAIQTTRVDLASALKTSDTGTARRQSLTGRNLLVAVQIALSLVLLTVAVFTFEVFRRELLDGPGWRTTHLAKMSMAPNQAGYTEAQSVQFFERVAANARRMPGVTAAAVTSAMPLHAFSPAPILPEGFERLPGQAIPQPLGNSVDETYLATMGISILEGRGFRNTDTNGSPRVAIINDTLARHYWPDGDALGKRFRMDDEQGPWVEIIGVAKTTKYFYLAEPLSEAVYFPFRQRPAGEMVLLAATAGDTADMLVPLHDMVQRMDADVPIFDVQTIEEFYDAWVVSLGTVITRMIGGIGLMGMVLTMVGLYGLVSYAVSRRTREIGIRIAIGASYGRVVRMILSQGMRPAWFGLAAGLALSAVAVRFLPALVPTSHSFDPRVYLLVVPLVFCVTLFAAFVPARRAARVDPTVALRCD